MESPSTVFIVMGPLSPDDGMPAARFATTRPARSAAASMRAPFRLRTVTISGAAVISAPRSNGAPM